MGSACQFYFAKVSCNASPNPLKIKATPSLLAKTEQPGI